MKSRIQRTALYTIVGGTLGFGLSMAYSYLGST